MPVRLNITIDEDVHERLAGRRDARPHSIASIRARWPGVPASGASQVTIGASSASASTTYMAS